MAKKKNDSLTGPHHHYINTTATSRKMDPEIPQRHIRTKQTFSVGQLQTTH